MPDLEDLLGRLIGGGVDLVVLDTGKKTAASVVQSWLR